MIATKGTGGAFSSLTMWSLIKGIFHFTVLVAAGEIERAFSNRILESWACSSSAFVAVVGAGHSMVCLVSSEGEGLIAVPLIGASPDGFSVLGSIELLGP